MAKLPALAPCPFCGSAPELRIDFRYPRPRCNRRKVFVVVCANIDCIIYNADGVYYFSKAKAVEAWNRRMNDDYQEG